MTATGGLEERFIRWCQSVGADEPKARELWVRLAGWYGEAGRHYHDLGHLAASLGWLDAVKPGDSAIEGAIWFHDVIYDPKRGDNEVRSVEFFREETPWIGRELSDAITRLILATDPRTPRSEAADEALMVDIDLAILGAAAEDYDAYRQAIRREYAHVPEEDFRRGRAAVMEGFLAGPIFRAEPFQVRELLARQNIAREIAELRSGGSGS